MYRNRLGRQTHNICKGRCLLMNTTYGDFPIEEIEGYHFEENTDGKIKNAATRVLRDCRIFGNCGKNLLNPDGFTAKGQYLMQTLCENDVKLSVSFIDKDTSVDISDVYFGFVYDTNKVNFGYVWLINNGVLREKVTNVTTTGELNKCCGTVMIYPQNAETVEKIFKRYKIQVEFGDETTDYAAYKNVGDLDAECGKYVLPVTVSGKNLIRYPYRDNTKTVSGVTFTDNGDGSITVNGTATNLAMFSLVSFTSDEIINYKKYIIATNQSKSLMNCYILWQYIKNNNYIGEGGTGAETIKILDLTAKDYDRIDFFIAVLKDTACENITLKPQLEFGENATDYEPYTAPKTTKLLLDAPLGPGESISCREKGLLVPELATTDPRITNYITFGSKIKPSGAKFEYYKY